MANKYCNLDGSKKISQEYGKINVGFDKVERDLTDIIVTPAGGVSEQEIINARGGHGFLGLRLDALTLQSNETATNLEPKIGKTQENLMLKDSFAKIKDGTMESFLGAISKGSCNVTFWGDSITAGSNYLLKSARWVELLESKLKKAFPDVSFTFNNLAISGLSSNQASDASYIVSKNSRSWANEDNKSWQYYIDKTQPDLVLVAFGMNPVGSMNAHAVNNVGIANFLKSIASKPSYIYLTNWVARKEWADANITGGQRTIENMARVTRVICDEYKFSYLDIHRVYKLLVDGKDDVIKNLKLETGFTNWTLHGQLNRYAVELVDFELQFYSKVTDDIRIQFRKESYMTIPKIGSVGFWYPGSIIVGGDSAVNLGDATHKFNLKVIGTSISLHIDDTLVIEKMGRGDLSDGYVRLGYLSELDNNGINNISMYSYQPNETFKSLTEDGLVGTYDASSIVTKLPYGGNGVNHPTSIAVNLLYNDALQDFVDYTVKSLDTPIYALGEDIKKNKVYTTSKATGVISVSSTTQQFITAMLPQSTVSFSHNNEHPVKLTDMPKSYGQVLLIKGSYLIGFFFSTDGNFYRWNQVSKTWGLF